MEKVEGINLAEIAREIENELLVEKRKQIADKIRFIHLGIRQASSKISEAKKVLERAEKSIQNAYQKLNMIKAENWHILDTINPNQKGESSDAFNTEGQ